MRAADSLELLKDVYKGWTNDEASRLAAALAFYAIFAIAPLFIIVIEIAAEVLGGAGYHNAVRDQILIELRPAIGDSGTKAIADLIAATYSHRSNGIIATIVGWVVFAVAASGLVLAVQDALDTIWNAKPQRGFVGTVLNRLKAVAIIGGGAVLVVVMGLLGTVADRLAFAIGAKIVHAIIVVVAAAVITGAIYKWLSSVELSWRDVWTGAIVSSLLAVVGQYAIGWYLNHVATTSAYGAAGSLVAILLWIYYSTQLFLVGGELTKAYARRFGSQRTSSGGDAGATGLTARTPRAAAR